MSDYITEVNKQKRVIWEGPVEAIPCDYDGQCKFVEEYATKYKHGFCYGSHGRLYCEKCPFYGLKNGTIVRMEVEE